MNTYSHAGACGGDCGCGNCGGGADPLCGCCAGTGAGSAPARANRPGLAALAWRPGTHASFLDSMLARLSGMELAVAPDEGGSIRPLAGLTTRATSDPAIALLDGWATVADVLGFYQERIANEGYLRTATERQSVAELARLVGYRIRPGVAASVHLAFTVAEGFRGALPKGTRAQSIPETGQLPQFFETDEALEARDGWNALKPRLTRPQTISPPFGAPASTTVPIGAVPTGTEADVIGTLYFRGTSTNLKTGDPLLIVLGRGQEQQVMRFVESVTPDARHDRTKVTLQETPFMVSFGRQALDNVRMAVEPYIEEAASIFAANHVAEQVSAILQGLVAGAAASTGTAEAVLPLVQSAIARIRDWHALALRRHFTRLEPWLADLLATLDTLVGQLPLLDVSVPDPEGPVATTVPAARATSPLERLAPLLDALARPASKQPASAPKLARSVTQVFARQSDMAPRLLARFHPAAASSLYQAWGNAGAVTAAVTVHALRVRAPLFGHSAPLRVTGVDNGVITRYDEWQVVEENENGDSTVFHEQRNMVSLDSAYDKVLPQGWVVVDTRAVDTLATRIVPTPGLLVAWTGPATGSVARTDYGISGKSTRVELLDPSSHGALDWLDLNMANEGSGADFHAIRNTVVYGHAEELALAEEPLDADIEGDSLVLAGLYDGLDTGRWVIVSGERTDIPGTSGVLASELAMIAAVAQGTRGAACALFPAGTPFAQLHYVSEPNAVGDRLVVGRLADPAALQALSPPAMANQLYCDQVQLAPGLYATAYVPNDAERAGDFAAFAGLLLDPVSGEALSDGVIPPARTATEGLWAWRISSAAPNTILTLASPLAYRYDAGTVTIHGNVVRASAGQTTGEVLGDGDAARPLQRFALHQRPLTWVAASSPAGIESTLEVRVNEVLWHQAGSLDALPGTAHAYMLDTVTGADGTDSTAIVFGDGVHGARLPTGSANVKALYRYGIGKGGNVKARQISQLATHPPGAQAVVNPLPASGGADADSRDAVRRNAPLAVMALDRLVSIQDYADFTRNFAGIAKSSAARLSDGRRQLVHVTVAGVDDIAIGVDSSLYRNLLAALARGGDPHQPVQVAPRRLKLLVMQAGVRVHPDYLWEAVEPRLRAALLAAFGFDARALGQDAIRSEALAVMQGVTGVAYVDLRVFDAVPESIAIDALAGLADSLALLPRVPAELARGDGTNGASGVLAAELAILAPDLPDTLILTEISP